MPQMRDLYRSSNGDGWSLCREDDGHVVVLHHVNVPAGGAVQRLELGDFLKPDHPGPEHQALAQLIGTLVA
jgi:hypothetical protein